MDGIIHSAGVLRDSFLLKKRGEESTEVLLPKIEGAKYLDQATKHIDLDFTIYCSSIASVLGNVGQSDYASANAWLDNYANYRNILREEGKRKGLTLSINWPLWKEGGMQVDKESLVLMKQKWGIQELPTATGLKAMEILLGRRVNQGIVFYGNQSQIRSKLFNKKKTSSPPKENNIVDKKHSSIKPDLLRSNAEKLISELASRLLKLDSIRLSTQKEFGEYGFDSILMTNFASELNDYYGIDLLPTVFYNYPSIQELAAFLVTDYSVELGNRHEAIPTIEQSENHISVASPIANSLSKRRKRFSQEESISHKAERTGYYTEPIAIVGMSARFPGAPDLTVFWEQLKASKDLITEIPEDRWDWRKYYGDAQKEKGKTKAKWGGFISDIDKFDPLFFSISPREAELMDPQQRIALISTYHALEDAGIAPQSIKGSNTGVFIGVSNHDYSQLVSKNSDQAIEAQFSTGNSHCVLVNRISYLLDLHGPSEPIDTACSSSLIAIHRAMENIRNGHCDMALAGGVNVLLSPQLTLSFSQAGMLCEDGRCKTFDQRANGYVRGEGVGMIVLKPLSKAQADGDQIHAIIRGSAENHGGKANTLTSPNPNSQKELLLKAYRSAGIDPRDVSYIEAHGTGTPLGDPIETDGLKRTFKELYNQSNLKQPTTPHIHLGSVKANIGHLETSAGIAGVLKVVLALKHKMLPGNPHLDTPNEYLKLENSPFILQKETTTWETKNDKARIAGVSSFGFGGANAHIVIEESTKEPSQYQSNDPVIILLSAKNAERLKEQTVNLSAYLTANKSLNLYDVAYTLQVGRDAMEERLALIVNKIEELSDKLRDYQEGKTEDLLTGNIKKDKIDFVLKGNAGKGYIEIAMRDNEVESLAQLWVKGIAIDWNLLYRKDNRPNKISLPTYSFASHRYWIPQSEEIVLTHSTGKLHPLLHQNSF